MSAPRCPRCAQPCVSPRLLPCLHPLCEPCLRRLEPPDGSPGAARPVLCPVCDAEVPLPASGVGQLLPRLLGREPRRGRVRPLCRRGDGRLCRFCCRAHRRQKKTASHAVTKLENTKDCSQAGKPLLCPSHPTEELQLFCEQCEQPMCRECILHHQHAFDFTSSVIQKHGDALRELLKSSQQHMDTLEDVLSQVDEMGSAVRSHAEAVARDICLFARGYVNAIEEHRDQLLKQLEDLKVQKENLLHLQKALLQQLLLDMRAGMEFTEHLLMSGSDVEILITKGFSTVPVRTS